MSILKKLSAAVASLALVVTGVPAMSDSRIAIENEPVLLFASDYGNTLQLTNGGTEVFSYGVRVTDNSFSGDLVRGSTAIPTDSPVALSIPNPFVEDEPYTVFRSVLSSSSGERVVALTYRDDQGYFELTGGNSWSRQSMPDLDLPETDVAFPNSAALSGDGRLLFVDMSSSRVTGVNENDEPVSELFHEGLYVKDLENSEGDWQFLGLKKPAEGSEVWQGFSWTGISASFDGSSVVLSGAGTKNGTYTTEAQLLTVSEGLSGSAKQIQIGNGDFFPMLRSMISGDGMTIVVFDFIRDSMVISRDGGESFVSLDPYIAIGPGAPATDGDNLQSAIDMSFDGRDILILSGDYISYSADHGASWTQVWTRLDVVEDIALLDDAGGFLMVHHLDDGRRGVSKANYKDTVLLDEIPEPENRGLSGLPQFMPADGSQSRVDSGDVSRNLEPAVEFDQVGNLTIAPNGMPAFAGYGGPYVLSSGSWVADETLISSNRAIDYSGDGSTLISVGYFTLDVVRSDDTTEYSIPIPDSHPGAPTVVVSSNDGNEAVFGFGTLGDDRIQDGRLYRFSADSVTEVATYAVTDPDADPIQMEGDWIALDQVTISDSSVLWAANKQGAIFRSSDFGASWTRLDEDSDENGTGVPMPFIQDGLRSVAFGDGGKIVAVTSMGKPYISSDSGISWTRIEQYGGWFRFAAMTDDGVNIAIINNLGTLISQDGGETWKYVALTAGNTSSAIFYSTGESENPVGLAYFRSAPDYYSYFSLYNWNLSTTSWDGETFGDRAEPTWGATIWNPVSTYVPNELSVTYETRIQEGEFEYFNFEFNPCDQGLSAGSCEDFPTWVTDSDKLELTVNAKVYLEPCTDSTPEGLPCIESLGIGAAGSVLGTAVPTDLQPEGGFVWEADQTSTTAIPGSGQPRIWNASRAHSGGTSTYTVLSSVDVEWTRDGLTYTNYAASVIPVTVIDDEVEAANEWEIPYGRIFADVGSESFGWRGNIDGCAWNDAYPLTDIEYGEPGTYRTICAQSESFAANTEVELRVRLPKTVAGWYKGRVTGPTLTAESSSASDPMQIVTVKGQPSYKVPQLREVQQTLGDTPSAFKFFGLELLGGGGILLSDDDDGTVRYITALKNGAGDQANAEESIWQFGTLAPAADACYAELPLGAIAGMVSTDAMSYSGKPPVFEAGELRYRVAGMHRYAAPDGEVGEVVSGSYDLLINSDYARCLYNLGEAELNPSVSVFETTTLAEKSGVTLEFEESETWMNFQVRGITFSNPTIALDFFGGPTTPTDIGGGAPSVPVVTTPPPVVTPPAIPSGQTGVVLVGGVPVNVTIAPATTPGTLGITGDGWSLALGTGASTPVLNSAGQLVLTPTNTPEIRAAGFQPNSQASMFLVPSGFSSASLGITSAKIRALATEPISLGSAAVDLDGTFATNLDLSDVAPGNYVLQINGAAPDGKIRSISVATNIPDMALRGWTKKISDTQVKVYVKNVVKAGKVQIFVNGEEIAWINAGDETDRKLRFAAGFNYLVRTVNLEPGKNRIEIRLDGERIRFVTYTLK